LTEQPQYSPTPIRRIRHIIFLKDVLVLALTCFGGPQVHFVLFLDKFVKQRRYLTEEELLELQALCQILPGPTSTQTITALGFQIGGAKLAYLTLFIWAMPAVVLMTVAAVGIRYLEQNHISLYFTRFIAYMAVAFLIFGGWSIGKKTVKTPTHLIILAISALVVYVFPSPYMTPLVIVLGALVTSLEYRKLKKMKKDPIKIKWANFILWLSVLIIAAIIGNITHWLPVLLFENFYRNGSLVFGGGQVLTPMLYTEFVEFKHYLSGQEFLSGMALAQVIPGPVFSIASFVGSLSMRNFGILGQLTGSVAATTGIFLPGTFLIFFVYRFWNELKQYRGIRASLEGINAASVGLTAATSLRMLLPIVTNTQAVVTIIVVLLLLLFTKIPPYFIIIGGIVLGLFL
jgi:chromate transporter